MAPGLLTPHIPSLQLTLEAVLHRSAANPQQRQLLLCHAGLLLDLIKSLVVFAHVTRRTGRTWRRFCFSAGF